MHYRFVTEVSKNYFNCLTVLIPISINIQKSILTLLNTIQLKFYYTLFFLHEHRTYHKSYYNYKTDCISLFLLLQQLRFHFQRIKRGVAKLSDHGHVGSISAVTKYNAVTMRFGLYGVKGVPFSSYVGFKPRV